jgi:hypothetical protein
MRATSDTALVCVVKQNVEDRNLSILGQNYSSNIDLLRPARVQLFVFFPIFLYKHLPQAAISSLAI